MYSTEWILPLFLFSNFQQLAEGEIVHVPALLPAERFHKPSSGFEYCSDLFYDLQLASFNRFVIAVASRVCCSTRGRH